MYAKIGFAERDRVTHVWVSPAFTVSLRSQQVNNEHTDTSLRHKSVLVHVT
jgi:hypothetical protein